MVFVIIPHSHQGKPSPLQTPRGLSHGHAAIPLIERVRSLGPSTIIFVGFLGCATWYIPSLAWMGCPFNSYVHRCIFCDYRYARVPAFFDFHPPHCVFNAVAPQFPPTCFIASIWSWHVMLTQPMFFQHDMMMLNANDPMTAITVRKTRSSSTSTGKRASRF